MDGLTALLMSIFCICYILVQTPLHLACLSGDLTTVEHIVDMVGTEYLLQLHGPQIKPVRVVLRHPFFYYPWQ